MSDAMELPQLPNPEHVEYAASADPVGNPCDVDVNWYTENAMRAYGEQCARAAVAAERERAASIAHVFAENHGQGVATTLLLRQCGQFISDGNDPLELQAEIDAISAVRGTRYPEDGGLPDQKHETVHTPLDTIAEAIRASTAP
ncbi:hypothetical protein [Acetobacter sp. DsW_063]|uniref:hypothetical protein n=1 Tax=Acetobacter sp. DsW_063 TaxID=1514894 RepID=UPI000A3A9DA7|nr:hypothetical protein [Acetobacter sp. DsW_063]OUJ16386.1 hypothetical protein HK28_00165 [Acetobacter sp. DsW_063]